MTTNPEYTLDYRQAIIALMTEPEGTIIEESSTRWCWKLRSDLVLSQSLDEDEDGGWNLSCSLPGSNHRYRIIPLPTPEPTPHVNPTLEECFAATKLTIEGAPGVNMRERVEYLERGFGWTWPELGAIFVALQTGAKVTIKE